MVKDGCSIRRRGSSPYLRLLRLQMHMPLSLRCVVSATLWVASFDGPGAFLATLLILYFCCVLVQVLLLCGK